MALFAATLVAAQHGPGAGPWQTSAPESQGLSTADLAAAAAGANDDMAGRVCYVVVKNGFIVHEQYYNNWQQDSIRAAFSTTKSMCASLYGIAVQQGWANVSTPIAGQGISTRDCNPASTFANVLTMTGRSDSVSDPVRPARVELAISLPACPSTTSC